MPNEMSQAIEVNKKANLESKINKWDIFSKNVKRDKFLILLVLPGVLNFIIWHYIPMYGILIVFKDYNMKLGILKSPWAEMFGLKHVIEFVNNPYFFRLVRNTVWLNLLQMIFVPIPGIIFALFLNEIYHIRFKKLVQTVSYFPFFLSSVSLVSIFVLILSPTTGLVNNFIKMLGGEPIYFVMEPKWFRTIFILMTIWQTMGWDTIIWLARITGVDTQLYESATIDGASRIMKMWYITLPAFKEWYFINLILGFGSLLATSGFEKIFLLYNPATYETADVFGTYIYRRGLQMGDFSYGEAVAFINSIICLFMLILANNVSKKFAEESIW